MTLFASFAYGPRLRLRHESYASRIFLVLINYYNENIAYLGVPQDYPRYSLKYEVTEAA